MVNRKKRIKETENKKKTPNFTVSVVADENTVKAGSDLVYTVTLENTGDVMLKNIQAAGNCFSNQNLQGEWSGDNLEQLDVGIKKELYLTVRLPENQESAVCCENYGICRSGDDRSRYGGCCSQQRGIP